MRGNLHRPYGFGRNGTVFGVAPPHNVEALTPRRSPKSGTVALRNLVTLSLAGTTRSLRGGAPIIPSLDRGWPETATVFGVAPPHNVEALTPRRSPKSGTVALRNLVTLSLAGTTRSLRGGAPIIPSDRGWPETATPTLCPATSRRWTTSVGASLRGRPPGLRDIYAERHPEYPARDRKPPPGADVSEGPGSRPRDDGMMMAALRFAEPKECCTTKRHL